MKTTLSRCVFESVQLWVGVSLSSYIEIVVGVFLCYIWNGEVLWVGVSSSPYMDMGAALIGGSIWACQWKCGCVLESIYGREQCKWVCLSVNRVGGVCCEVCSWQNASSCKLQLTFLYFFFPQEWSRSSAPTCKTPEQVKQQHWTCFLSFHFISLLLFCAIVMFCF